MKDSSRNIHKVGNTIEFDVNPCEVKITIVKRKNVQLKVLRFKDPPLPQLHKNTSWYKVA